jgi:osmotically-inducible protein OsmY
MVKTLRNVIGILAMTLALPAMIACQPERETEIEAEAPTGETMEADIETAPAGEMEIGNEPEPAEGDLEQAGEEVVDEIEKVGDAAENAGQALRDAEITASVKTALIDADNVNADSIDVDTKDNVVTLSGTVGSEAEREEAERIAREREGVEEVVNDLRVGG